MKKFVFCAVVLLLAAPVRAVDIWCEVTAPPNEFTISYDASTDDPMIRAFALDIQVLGAGTISEVECLSGAFGYHIHPGSISIDGSGNVSDWGSCRCSGSYPGTLDEPNAMTIEMGSAYEAGVDPDPCDAGDLVRFRVSGADSISASITVNEIRGGVVDEDAGDPTVNISHCYNGPELCMARWAAEYEDYVAFGSPACWCYRKQCRGDIDGVNTGPFPVAIPDLTLFKAAFNQVVIPEPPGVCADLDHLQTGPFRCAIPDLTIFKQNFNQVVVPQCDQEPIYTGPYNFWTN